MFGDHVQRAVVSDRGAAGGTRGEPDLDLARATGAASRRREVEELGLGVAR
jgi:hypothetical protein